MCGDLSHWSIGISGVIFQRRDRKGRGVYAEKHMLNKFKNQKNYCHAETLEADSFKEKQVGTPISPFKNLRVTMILTIIIFSTIFSRCNKQKDISQNNTQQIPQTNWPIFRGDNNFSGNAKGSLPDSLQLLWKFQTEDEISASPVVMDGKVYFASLDGKLYCADAESGKEIWKYEITTSFEASPMVLNNTVYIGNVNRKLYAIDADSGFVKWEFETGGKIMGSPNWSVNPETKDTLVFQGCYDSKMYCFNAKTGEKIWTYDTKNFINGAPAIYKDYLIFGGCDAFVHQVSTITGKRKVKVNLESYLAASPSVYENFVYVGNYDSELIAVNLEDTVIVWKYYDEEEGAPFFSSPAVTKKYVVIGSRDYRLHCVDRLTGERVWVFRTNDDVESSPVIIDGKVIFCSADGRVYVLKLDDGSMIWQYEIGSVIISSPAVASGRIYIGAEDGNLYCFGK